MPEENTNKSNFNIDRVLVALRELYLRQYGVEVEFELKETEK